METLFVTEGEWEGSDEILREKSWRRPKKTQKHMRKMEIRKVENEKKGMQEYGKLKWEWAGLDSVHSRA